MKLTIILSDQSLMMDPLSSFSFKLVFHDWYNEGSGICYPVCGLVYIKDPFLLIEKSNLSNGLSGFPLLLSGQVPYILHCNCK